MIYYLPSVAGIATYLLLIQVFGGKISPPLAWTNTVVGITSLALTTVLYMPALPRKCLLDRWLLSVSIAAAATGVGAAIVSNHPFGVGTVLFAVTLLHRNLSAIAINDETRTLRISLVNSVALPVSAMLALVPSMMIHGLLVAAAMALILLLTNSSKAAPLSQEDAPPKGATSLDLEMVAASSLTQAALFLYPLFELRVVHLSDAQEYASFVAYWKVIFGTSVVLYSKVQFQLAFKTPNDAAVKNHAIAAVLSLVAVLILSAFNIPKLLAASIIFASVFANAVAVIVRTGLRIQPSVKRASVAFLLFAALLAWVQGDAFRDLLAATGRSGVAAYPLLICAAYGTALVSFPLATMKRRRSGSP